MKEIMFRSIVNDGDVAYFTNDLVKTGIYYDYYFEDKGYSGYEKTLDQFIEHFNYQNQEVIDFIRTQLS